MDTAGVIRTILLADVISMTLLGLFYLSQRRLGWRALCGWSLLAVCVPVLGPFLVIASRPGSWNRDFSLRRSIRRAGLFFRSRLPARFTATTGLSRIERARRRILLRRDTRAKK